MWAGAVDFNCWPKRKVNLLHSFSAVPILRVAQLIKVVRVCANDDDIWSVFLIAQEMHDKNPVPDKTY
jgi:hypothetical protein